MFATSVENFFDQQLFLFTVLLIIYFMDSVKQLKNTNAKIWQQL